MATTAQTRERDVETARRFYADLLAFEARMEAAGDEMSNRGRWLDAQSFLREACEELERFIGDRLTADLREAAYEVRLERDLAAATDESDTRGQGE